MNVFWSINEFMTGFGYNLNSIWGMSFYHSFGINNNILKIFGFRFTN